MAYIISLTTRYKCLSVGIVLPAKFTNMRGRMLETNFNILQSSTTPPLITTPLHYLIKI